MRADLEEKLGKWEEVKYEIQNEGILGLEIGWIGKGTVEGSNLAAHHRLKK